MFIQYLIEYNEQLGRVKVPDDLFGHVLQWQANQRKRGEQAQDEFNRDFFPKAKSKPYRLASRHPPTTAVGGFKGLVVIAANPGYDEQRNETEFQFRERNNRAFCKSFFKKAKDLTMEISWWRSVAQFAHVAVKGEEEKNLCELWKWADRSKCIGAVDLIPFHSEKDGVTALIERNSSGKSEKGQKMAALRATAIATFKMVIQLQPQVVLVASRAGASIAKEVLRTPPIKCELLWCPVTNPWGDKFRYKIHHYRAPGTHVLVMQTQLFSKRAGLSRLQKKLATTINTEKLIRIAVRHPL